MANKQLAPKLILKDDGTLIIKNVRLSYEHVFNKWSKDPDDPKEKPRFSAVGLLDKVEHAKEIEALQALLVKIQKEFFKGRLPADKLFLRDGDLTGKDEYEGKWALTASDPKLRPIVVDKDGKTPIVESDDKIYSGCFINLMFKPWNQQNKHGKRINANLIGVQFVADGDRFGGDSRPAADEAFENEDFEEEGGDDGFDD